MSSSSSTGTESPAGCDTQAGGKNRPYKLCIVGGGPAGHSILVRAMRLGIIDEVCRGSAAEAGVALLDGDTAERLGGGRLQDYLINANTWADNFYTNVCEDKPNNIPPETIAGTPLVALTGSAGSAAGEALLAAGQSEAPLATVGSFLVEVGTAVRKALEAHPTSCLLAANTTVQSVQRVVVMPLQKAEGEKQAVAAEKEVEVEVAGETKGEGGSDTDVSTTAAAASTATASPAVPEPVPVLLWKVSTRNHVTEQHGEFYCTNCVLATGGRQLLPDLKNKAFNAKLITSDRVCTEEGIAEVKRRLLAADTAITGSTAKPGCVRNKRIVIVGGSHSAFSAAWMCLNKLGLETEVGSLGTSSIMISHRSAVRVFYACKKDAELDNYDNIGHINKLTGQIHPFGGLRGDAKELWRGIKQGREQRVRLLKSAGQSMQAKMYEEASIIIWACGYSTNTVPILCPDGSSVCIKLDRGQVDVDERARLMSEANLEHVTLQGPDGKPVRGDLGGGAEAGLGLGLPGAALGLNSPKRTDRGGSAAGQAAAAPGGGVSTGFVVSRLFGVGLGYGLRATLDTTAEPDGSTGRADGVAVYLKRAATLVLAGVVKNVSSVFGFNDKTGRAVASWEERLELYGESKKSKRKEDRAASEEEKKESSSSSSSSSKSCPPIADVARPRTSASMPPMRSSTSPTRAQEGRPTRFPSIGNGTSSASAASNDKAQEGKQMRRSSLDDEALSAATAGKRSMIAKGRSGVVSRSSSLVSTREAARSAFSASCSTTNSVMSSLAVYEMPPEFQAKLHRQLDPNRVAQAVSRLSMPKSAAAVAKAAEKEGGAKASFVIKAPVREKPSDKPLRSSSAKGSSGSASPDSACDSSASSKSSEQHRSADDKEELSPKTTEDARKMLRMQEKDTSSSKASIPAAPADTSPASSSPPVETLLSTGAPVVPPKSAFSLPGGRSVPKIIAASPIRSPKLLALAQKSSFSPVKIPAEQQQHRTPDAAVTLGKSDTDTMLASLSTKRGLFSKGNSAARGTRPSPTSDPRLFKLDDNQPGASDAMGLTVLSSQGKKLVKAWPNKT